ncbi:MAG TPA: IclR family transcriptional regulator [Candidatus Sulfotelmatobacter sp.]|nr:IclR family transcriptional regulator [Candidatus Sulfotelmatobacter sp.]
MDKTVVKAFTLLEALAAHGQPRRVTELARELGMAKSNVHRLLQTLAGLGYVYRDEHGLYAAGLALWERGMQVLSHLAVRRAASGHLRGLAALSSEQVNLAIRDGAEVLYVASIEGTLANPARPVLGRRAPIHCVSSGKVILAFQPDEVVRATVKLLQQETPRTVATLEHLKAELAEVRRRGFAMNLGEWRSGIHGIAAPVAGLDGAIVAAISIAGPAERLDAKRLRALAPHVAEAAHATTLALAYASSGEPPSERPRRAPRPVVMAE